MKLGSAKADDIVEKSGIALDKMTAKFSDIIKALIHGDSLETVLGSTELAGFKRYRYPDNAMGGRASALNDLAVVITSADPAPFSAHLIGETRKEVINHINTALLMHASIIHKEWTDLLGADIQLFPMPLPSLREGDQSLRIMFLTVTQAILPYLKWPNPFDSTAAQSFARAYTKKLWPIFESSYGANTKVVSAPADCPRILEDAAVYLQIWWFSVGKTQVEPQNTNSIRKAENLLMSVRDELCRMIREENLSEQISAQACLKNLIRRVNSELGPQEFCDVMLAALAARYEGNRALNSVNLPHPNFIERGAALDGFE